MDLQQYYNERGGSLEREPTLTYGRCKAYSGFDFGGNYYGFDFGSFISNVGETVQKVTAKLPAISVSSKKGTFSSGPQGLQWTSMPSIPKTTTALTPSEQMILQQQATSGPDLMKWLPLAIPIALFFLKK